MSLTDSPLTQDPATSRFFLSNKIESQNIHFIRSDSTNVKTDVGGFLHYKKRNRSDLSISCIHLEFHKEYNRLSSAQLTCQLQGHCSCIYQFLVSIVIHFENFKLFYLGFTSLRLTTHPENNYQLEKSL
ncbi:hypothetical protein RF11_13365 [Thelohanellus kitauei]|uniref:Uncharacterized protein n=1 Tax=Thelohanellus kitauei TaxID=669202 RepID=A0A0C2JGB0_THEKT|nr:hypothetical protein RF11_13365 [Thelohanellus kitauei]